MMQKRKARLQMARGVRGASLWSTIQLMLLLMLSLFTLIQMILWSRKLFTTTSSSSSTTSTSNQVIYRRKNKVESIELPTCLKDLVLKAERRREGQSSKGIVLPLFDQIALLGKSLVMEIRHFEPELSIEIPHCGDLDQVNQKLLTWKDPHIHIYDVCKQALTTCPGLFCTSLESCHRKFRSFDIKILSVLMSQFNELILLDADTLFFQNPTTLWNLQAYQTTGTFFFRDRLSYDHYYLAKRIHQDQSISVLHTYMSRMSLSSSFKQLQAIPRSKPTVKNHVGVSLHYEPSDELLKSHAWHLRSGHLVDSSLLLWNKQKQPRATAILGSFISNGGLPRPPSYGDKELYFFACELAETSMSFSEFAVGAIGNPPEEKDTRLCGEALHYFPSKGKSSELLYMNSDEILNYDLSQPIYRTVARGWENYPGSHSHRHVGAKCSFDVTLQSLTPNQMDAIKKRQQAYKEAEMYLMEAGTNIGGQANEELEVEQGNEYD